MSKFELPDDPAMEAKECGHEPCIWCQECHTPGCHLYATQCLSNFLLNFIDHEIEGAKNKETWLRIREAVTSDDVYLDDLEQFSFLFPKILGRKKEESKIFSSIYNKFQEYYRSVSKKE